MLEAFAKMPLPARVESAIPLAGRRSEKVAAALRALLADPDLQEQAKEQVRAALLRAGDEATVKEVRAALAGTDVAAIARALLAAGEARAAEFLPKASALAKDAREGRPAGPVGVRRRDADRDPGRVQRDDGLPGPRDARRRGAGGREPDRPPRHARHDRLVVRGRGDAPLRVGRGGGEAPRRVRRRGRQGEEGGGRGRRRRDPPRAGAPPQDPGRGDGEGARGGGLVREGLDDRRHGRRRALEGRRSPPRERSRSPEPPAGGPPGVRAAMRRRTPAPAALLAATLAAAVAAWGRVAGRQAPRDPDPRAPRVRTAGVPPPAAPAAVPPAGLAGRPPGPGPAPAGAAPLPSRPVPLGGVLAAEDGSPVASAEVTLFGPGGEVLATATTADEQGTARFPAAPCSASWVSASAPGFARQAGPCRSPGTRRGPRGSSCPGPCHFGGVVVDADRRRPVAGAAVRLAACPSAPSTGPGTIVAALGPARPAGPDRDGGFRFADGALAPGEHLSWFLEVEAEGYARRRLRVVDAAALAGGDVRLPDPAGGDRGGRGRRPGRGDRRAGPRDAGPGGWRDPRIRRLSSEPGTSAPAPFVDLWTRREVEVGPDGRFRRRGPGAGGAVGPRRHGGRPRPFRPATRGPARRADLRSPSASGRRVGSWSGSASGRPPRGGSGRGPHAPPAPPPGRRTTRCAGPARTGPRRSTSVEPGPISVSASAWFTGCAPTSRSTSRSPREGPPRWTSSSGPPEAPPYDPIRFPVVGPREGPRAVHPGRPRRRRTTRVLVGDDVSTRAARETLLGHLARGRPVPVRGGGRLRRDVAPRQVGADGFLPVDRDVALAPGAVIELPEVLSTRVSPSPGASSTSAGNPWADVEVTAEQAGTLFLPAEPPPTGRSGSPRSGRARPGSS